MHYTIYRNGLSVLTLVLIVFASGVFAVPAVAQSADDGPDENEIRRYYSLYLEDFRNEDFEHAIPNLRWILEHAPAFPGDDARNFDRMVKSFVGLADATEDEEQKRTYLDSALVYADRAIPELQELGAEVDEYRWHLEKGRIIETHSSLMSDRLDEAIAAYRNAYEFGPDRIDRFYLDRLIRTYLREDRRDDAIAFMDDIEQIRGDEEEIQEMLDEWRDRVFRSPEERIAYLEGRVERFPDDVELLTELFDLYIRNDHDAEASRLADRLLELEPTARVHRLVAQMRMDDGEYDKAYEHYQQAVAMADEPGAEVFYNMGIAQQHMGQLSRARTYFREALDVDPSFGRAYFAIGDLYARTVSQCSGPELERQDRAVYWLVVDYYQRAKQADPSLANQADQNIASYRGFFPTREAMFFQGWEVGATYRVDSGCYAWINEATTMRAQ